MHIYFSGIGGAGIGPLALIAHQAGYTVTGSDKTESQYTEYLRRHGITLHIGQTRDKIEAADKQSPIDWIVMSSAIQLENPQHDELVYAQEKNIKISKRDALLNEIISQKNLELLAVAGTHGKTTTTAMLIWGAQKLGIPVSYSVGAKISFGDMGHYEPGSKYFIYECDEFDRNFLQFSPKISGITTIDWDHHDIYPTREEYKEAFRQFISKSQLSILFVKDADYIELATSSSITSLSEDDENLKKITLHGEHNRRNALVAAHMLQTISDASLDTIVEILNDFPGTQRRFEKIVENIYSDYAHTPEEIAATLQLAKELNNTVVVVYEPLTNKRQHFMQEQYNDIFEPATKVYWTPSYLAREDPNQHILTPSELIAGLSPNTNAVSAELNDDLLNKIKEHAANGALVLCMAGGGGGSLDEYLRANLTVQ